MATEKLKFRAYAAHKVHNYINRQANTPIECRIALFVLICSYVNVILSVIATFASAIYLIANKQRIRTILSDNINIIAIFFILMEFFVGLVHKNIVGTAACLFFTALFIIMACLRAVVTRRFYEDMITCHLTYSVIAAVVAIIERLMNVSDPLYRSSSTFLNPLYFSYFIALAAVMCTYRLVISPRAKFAHTLVLLINLTSMFLSGGRLPWMGMFIGCLAVLVLCKRYRLLLIFIAAITFLVSVAALFPDIPMFSALRLNSIESGYDMRLPYWKRSIECLAESPISGQGFLSVLNKSIGDNAYLFQKFFETFNLNTFFNDMKSRGWMLHSHNILFDFISSFGVIGTLMLLFCIVRYLSKMYRNFKYKSSQPMISLMIGFICAVGVNSILDCQYIGGQTAVFTMILFSATGLKMEKEYDDRHPEFTIDNIRKFIDKKLGIK